MKAIYSKHTDVNSVVTLTKLNQLTGLKFNPFLFIPPCTKG